MDEENHKATPSTNDKVLVMADKTASQICKKRKQVLKTVLTCTNKKLLSLTFKFTENFLYGFKTTSCQSKLSDVSA